MFLCKSKSTLFGLLKVDAFRNHRLRLFTTEQHNPNVRICATHLMDDSFVKPSRVQGWLCTKDISKKKRKKRVNSDFAMTIISDRKYVLLLVQVFAIDCSNAEFCA